MVEIYLDIKIRVDSKIETSEEFKNLVKTVQKHKQIQEEIKNGQIDQNKSLEALPGAETMQKM